MQEPNQSLPLDLILNNIPIDVGQILEFNLSMIDRISDTIQIIAGLTTISIPSLLEIKVMIPSQLENLIMILDEINPIIVLIIIQVGLKSNQENKKFVLILNK